MQLEDGRFLMAAERYDSLLKVCLSTFSQCESFYFDLTICLSISQNREHCVLFACLV